MTQNQFPSSLRYWRPAELAALIIGFIIFWPLGLAVLAWKYWNDRSSSPRNLDDIVNDASCKIRTGLSGVFRTSADTAAFTPTGNAQFDAYVRHESQRLDAQRKALDEEIRAFRAFLDQERAGGADLYERFRNRSGAGPASDI